MNLPDVNILVYAFRTDSNRHGEYRGWLQDVLNGDSILALSEQVLSSVIRLTTHPRVFREPTPRHEVIAYVEALRGHQACRIIRPSERHWPLFLRLCERADARANLITDAWFAALALESGCTWITTDRDFARFPGLRWRHPLDHAADVENPA